MTSNARETAPLVLARQGWFYVGGAPGEDGAKVGGKVGQMRGQLRGQMRGQMYVEFQLPQRRTAPFPLVFVHGGNQTGTNWTGTPDGREGWATFFLRRGYAVYVVDQPARGRSPHAPADDALAPVSRAFVDRRFVAPARSMEWPQAALHTQWPGTGEPGDPAYDAFLASQAPSLQDYPRQQALGADAMVALLDRIGPAIVVTHSRSAPLGWACADRRPHLAPAIVALEPNGPPAHDVDFLGAPRWFADAPHEKAAGLCDIALTYEPPLAPGEKLRFVRADDARDAQSVPCWRQAEPARRLPHLARAKILMLTGEASYHAPYDHCTAAYLRQAGVSVDHVYLAERGIRGNGHMMMIERNSDAIAALTEDWLSRQFPHTPVREEAHETTSEEPHA